ncbi:MAG: outer membrane beta-barrel protein [Acidobacteriaceae bacterium]|nr:outer membrane beta-barrel protein [Acidobacteriaceae bacterium]
MKNRILTVALSLALLAAAAYAQEGQRNEATVSALGSFQQTTNGNGIQQSGNNAAGVLVSYRYFFTNHQGVELNYGFSRFDQQFNLPGALSVPANTNEATASYVFKWGIGHGLTPFASAGTGAFAFVPTNSFTVNGASASTFATPDFVYSVGTDVAVNRRLTLRLGYRGHVLEAPDFNVPGLYTGSVAHIAQPFAGLSIHW